MVWACSDFFVFMYSIALRAAIVPSATARVICRYFFATASPAANTPLILVCILLSVIISFLSFKAMHLPFRKSVFASYPININTPSSFISETSEVRRSLTDTDSNFSSPLKDRMAELSFTSIFSFFQTSSCAC